MTKTKKNNFLINKLIVITRPESNSVVFQQELEKHGAQVYTLPTINIIANPLNPELQRQLNNIASYEWIIFTSAKGVDYFMEALAALKVDRNVLKNKKIAVVGPKTAQKLNDYDLNSDFMPTKYTTAQLAKELANINELNILLARSAIGSKKLVRALEEKGAVVTDIPIYKTEFIYSPDKKFEKLLQTDKINYITFTSPSTVDGFLERVKESELLNKVFTIPILSVGPVTTETAQKRGFQNIITADTYTTNGMIKKLLEIV